MTKFKARIRQGIHILAVTAVLVFGASYMIASTHPESAEAAGANYYVDSVNGSDSNSGTSSTSAWKSLSAVQNHIFSAGDTINFARGSSWTGNLTVKNSGAAGNPITLKAYGTGAAPVVSYPNVQYGHSIDINGSYVIVEDFLARDGNEAGISINSGANNVIVQNNEITAVGGGVLVKGGNALVTHNYVHDLTMIVNTQSPNNDDYGAEGIFLSASSNTEVSYNKFVNCVAPSYDYGLDGGTIEFWGNVSGANVHHNYSKNANGFMEIGGGAAQNITVAYNISDRDTTDFAMVHLSGGFASTVSNFKVDNNTIVRSDGGYRILDFGGATPPSSFYFRNNIVYGNTSVASASGFTHNNNDFYLSGGAGLGSMSLGSGEKQADPKFVNASGGDYHLTSGSPAINAGANLGYATDYDGKAVPSTPDAGVYEYGSSSPAPTATTVPPTVTPAPTSTSTPAPVPTTTATPAPSTGSGPVGYWKMDEGTGTTTADSSGKGDTGNLYNGAAWTSGVSGKALSFNGVNNYVQVNNNSVLSPLSSTGEMTVATWVNLNKRPATTGQGRSALVAKGSSNNWEYALYAYANGQIGFSTWQLNGNPYGEVTGGSLPLNQWHLLVATVKKGQSVQLYMDGNLVGQTSSLSGSTGGGSSPLYFARRGDGQYTNAVLDGVRIYNRVLSLSEIQGLK
jgi:hypothetical protein